ncbi:MAG: SH3 domain-containing protein [Candidatus Acidiferrales bacterium]
MRKILLGSALLLVFCVAAYLRFHHLSAPLEVAYAGNRQVTLMSTTAQVRSTIATVNFGDRLDVLERFQDQVKVRTTKGLVGWVNERDVLSADLWQKSHDLDTKTATMSTMAYGHTRALANLHISPGRDSPRLRQLSKSVPVDLFERQPVEVPNSASARSNDQDEDATEPPEAKKEDWWLVRANTGDQNGTAGWLIGRFVALDVPSPLPDYASSAGMRIVGWFELNRVKDSAGNPKPQFLVLGTHGPEGQPCDFSMLRVYTWGARRQRYETAFVDSKVCGKLPLKLMQSPAADEVTFLFQDIGNGAPEERTYRMHQTIVRRVKQEGRPAPRKHR